VRHIGFTFAMLIVQLALLASEPSIFKQFCTILTFIAFVGCIVGYVKKGGPF